MIREPSTWQEREVERMAADLHRAKVNCLAGANHRVGCHARALNHRIDAKSLIDRGQRIRTRHPLPRLIRHAVCRLAGHCSHRYLANECLDCPHNPAAHLSNGACLARGCHGARLHP